MARKVGTVEILSELILLEYQVIFVNENAIPRNSATIFIVKKKMRKMYLCILCCLTKTCSGLVFRSEAQTSGGNFIGYD